MFLNKIGCFFRVVEGLKIVKTTRPKTPMITDLLVCHFEAVMQGYIACVTGNSSHGLSNPKYIS
ncbi:hypothetical protein AZI85_15230 [Bdellovibrio bacteriovorus]|uniref:Uncharacterized protein n=1 Tax=Bdellovibrio bacteriovorus TaxID=959 RepID=A0A150WUD3_BDEBC|nr:hypothetical protein AZI85_15230 [Bdellovibrio bacteriovorus]